LSADNRENDNFQPVLEMPPTVQNSVENNVAGALFAESDISVTLGKLAVLESFISALTHNCNFTDFIKEILLAVVGVVKCEAGSIFELDCEKNVLFFRAAIGRSSDQIVKFNIPVGQGIVGHVAESRFPMLVDNVSENKVHLKAIEAAVGFETRNMIAIPIIIRGRVYGVLELLNRIGQENFSNEDLEFLNYLCQFIAKAIEIRLMIAWAGRK
jgi:GAF domain-containing protein